MPNIEEKLANLPPELLPYKANILATVKPVIEITLSPADDLPLWASKVGGKPYLPLDVEYPYDKNGNPLLLLAQINCEELPQNDIFPKTGILSFFISGDDLYGLDFDNRIKQNGFAVFYFDRVIKDKNLLWTDFLEIQTICAKKDLYSPIENNESYKIDFQLSQTAISRLDFNFERDFFDNTDFRNAFLKSNETTKALCFEKGIFDSSGHHLLGYPYFTQQDPRDEENFSNYILLFQLDSEYNDKVKIFIADSGVMNFFIDPKDLANKDFSKVLYNWDC